MKRSVSLILAIVLLMSLTFVCSGTVLADDLGAMPFRDVEAGTWYTDAVSFVYEKGLMNGTGEDTFSPDTALTRAQLVTILWRYAGEPVVNFILPWSDVEADAWYAEAARWAASERITNRGGGSFGPDEVLSREETALLLWNTAKALGADVSVGEDTNILSYDDAFDLTEGYASAMQWAVGANVIRGTSETTLSPQGTLNRAQAATMLLRFHTALHTRSELSLWTEDAAAADALIAYVKAVTDPDGADFIPERDRIAVFDMDGTLTCETYYTYYDTMMFIEYCLYDHPERVSDELKEVAASIKPGYVADETLARNFAKAYAGMTVEEFYNYAVEFGQKYTTSFHNMRYIDGFYLPMVQLVQYLFDNGFEIWVVSGTERTTTRAIVANSPIRDCVEPEHVIGTDFEVKQRGHEDEPSNMSFKYENGDELVLTGGFIQKNLNGNKSIYVQREIGKRPVLAFGNSGSDTSMMNYALDSRNPYPAQAYMIVADDDVREWGTQDWTEKSADYLARGFIPISMKNDFVQIYPDGITKAARQYVPAQSGPSSPDDIRSRGVLRVGTTGDYRPMSFRDPETGTYWGFDAELAEDLADALGVELEYVPTTWPTLMADTLAGKFDLAICGITVTDARKEQALMSDGYLGNGKTVLCRAEDADKYTSLDVINRPEVTVMENPGGLNEKFAREYLPNATLAIHEVNEEIPGLVASGAADVMITEILEAGWYVGQDSRLAAPLIYEPFTQGQLGVLMPKGSETLLSYVNSFLAKEKASGRIDALAEEYIYQYIDGALDAAA